MKISSFCLPTKKEIPSDVKMASHILMIRSGMIRMETAGIYTWLPLGYRILKKIESKIIYEHEKENINQILMPTIQSAEIWKKSERYESYGEEMLRVADRHNKELLYGPTNEEMMTEIGANIIKSYKNLPARFFHIQSKFRDEIRPRFGVMRSREFLMKDAYSFDLSEIDLKKTYETFFNMYKRIFASLCINVIPVKALSGEIGGELSHEFHLLSESGESQIMISKELKDYKLEYNYNDLENKYFSSTLEYFNEKKIEHKLLLKKNSIELGHIFSFGNKYTKKFNFLIDTPTGRTNPLMGSYGIGISRIPAAIIENSHDNNGIIWPKKLSPFDLTILNLKPDSSILHELSEKIYFELKNHGFDVLYDDRHERIGIKFSDADLIGIPLQIIIGKKFLDEGLIQIKLRKTGEQFDINSEQIINMTKSLMNDDKQT